MNTLGIARSLGFVRAGKSTARRIQASASNVDVQEVRMTENNKNVGE
jgi:hypothetical protein